MTERLQELRERRRVLWEEAKSLLQEAEANNRDMGADENARYEALVADVDHLTREIGNRERADSIETALAQPQPEPKIERDRATADGGKVPGSTNYDVAFRQWLRGGMGNLDGTQQRMMRQYAASSAVDPREQRALGIATGGAGGYTVPQGFLRKITEYLKLFGGVRQVANVIQTAAGNALPWPAIDDTANVGAILAENTGMTQQDVVFTTKTLNAYMYTSLLVLVSYQLLEDTAFDLESKLGQWLGTRIGRIQNTHFTVGTGTGQPEGIQTNSVIGTTLATGNTTTVTYGGLIDLITSVDPAYRQGGNAQFMMSDTALATVRKLTDTQNRPLWQPSVQAGYPDTLLGYSVVINQDMPVPAANAKSILFGDFNQGYIIRDVLGIQVTRLDERYADALQVGFFAFARADGKPDNTAAFKALKHSAT